MDRRERRRRKRLEAKLKEKLSVKESSPPHIEHKESPTRLKRILQVFQKTVSGTKLLWSLVGAVLALLAGFALFRPQVSLDPDILLNPGDPFSTEFSVTNRNRIFTAKDLRPACYTIFVETSNNVEIDGPSSATIASDSSAWARRENHGQLPTLDGRLRGGSRQRSQGIY